MGYRKKGNEEEYIKQAGEVKENTAEIIEKIKNKCNESNFKDEVNGIVKMFKHYELGSGLHVYIGGNRTIISEKELRGEELYGFNHVNSDYIRLDRYEKKNLDTNEIEDSIMLTGKNNLGSIDENRKGISTTAEHVDYLEPEDKSIFDLAENQTKRLSDEDRQQSESALKAFKEMVEKEIGEIEKQVENKESEKVEPEKIEPEKIEPEKIEPEKIEPEKVEPENIEPEKSEPEKAEPKKIEPEADNINRNDIEDEKTKKIETIMKGIEALDLSQEEIDKLTEYLKMLKTRQAEVQQNAQGEKKQEDEQHGG